MMTTMTSTYQTSCSRRPTLSFVTQYHHILRADGSLVEIAWTDTTDGDFHVDDPNGGLTERRRAVMDGRWAVARQVHGSNVVDAALCLDVGDLPHADGVISGAIDQPISVQGADCAPIAFVTEVGPIGVAHAGWRGLAAGIIDETVGMLNSAGGTTVAAVVGPVICTDCYEFGAADLDEVAGKLGEAVRAQTKNGTPALDMRAGITGAFEQVGVSDVLFVGGCPACDKTGFSHRARQDPQRHCLVARVRT